MIYPTFLIALAVLVAEATPNPQTPRPSNVPKLGQAPVPFGPKPTGCSKFELIVGRS
jgi:hypothetical protein